MLEIKNLEKSYIKKTVLKGLDLKLEKGKILGLLGPNGSGKTTFIKSLMNITKYSAEVFKIDNENICQETNKYISYLADQTVFDKNEKINSILEKYKYFYEDFDLDKAKSLLKEMNLDISLSIKKLSKGMIEKLQLILVLSRDAKLYILDEPIAGVDILTRQDIMKLIISNLSENKSAIITTHLIADIEQIFDQVCFIKDGKLSQIYDVEDLRNNKNISVEQLYIDYFGGNKNV